MGQNANLAVGFHDLDHNDSSRDAVGFLESMNADQRVREVQQYAATLLGVCEGARILDAGCGLGDVTQDLASRVGRTGRVVGIDLSERMVAEARERTEGTGLPVEFHVGDIHHLDFPDESFDGTRASRVFIYVERPLEALGELLRLTRPGGAVVLFEPELDSWVLDGPDRNVVRRLIHFWTDQLRNPWAARRLPGLLRTLGVTEILANPVAGPWTMSALEIFGLRPVTDRAVQEGVATRAEVDEWLHFLEDSHRTGRFFGASMGVVIRGIKPAT